jgi:carbon monoxide dehydrogenase subunit G
MGREVIAENRVLELTTPHRLRYETRSDASDGTSVWEVRAVDGGTLVRHVAEGEVKGFFASLAMSLLKSNVNKQFNSDMKRLERRFNEDV